MNMRLLCVFLAAMVGGFAAAPASAAGDREEAVTVAIQGGHLSGTLLLPLGNGPYPVALMIAGSGPTDRNGNSAMGLATDCTKKLAEGLAAQGIATLRYDKRGIGASVVQQTESDVRFDDFVSDALVVAAVLERDPRFSSVSIIGHSEGSLIGMLVAERDARIRSLVSLEGAGRNLATILNEQVRANAANPQSIIDEVESINASLLAGKTVPSPDPQLAALFRPSIQPYLISEYRYDPAVEIAKLQIPVLVVHGTADIQVAAVDAQALAVADPKARVATIAGMNHILVDAPADRAGNIATYRQPALPISAGLVPAIAAFLK